MTTLSIRLCEVKDGQVVWFAGRKYRVKRKDGQIVMKVKGSSMHYGPACRMWVEVNESK